MCRLLLKKLLTTKKRSSRKEYILKFLLSVTIFLFVNYSTKMIEKANLFTVIYIWMTVIVLLITIIQYFPLSIRRLHDLNASGWYVLLTFAPFGQLLILWLMLKKGTEGPNKYGNPPEY